MNELKFCFFSSFAGFINFFFGVDQWCIKLLSTLTFFMLIDLVFGIVSSIQNKTFSKSILFAGLWKKAKEFILISIMYQLDTLGTFANIMQLEPFFLWAFLGYEFYSIWLHYNDSDYPAYLKDVINKIVTQFNSKG